MDDAAATNIYGNLETPPIDEDAAELESQIDEPTQNPRNPPPEIAIPADAMGTVTQQILHPNNAQEPTPPSTSPNGTIPKNRSLAQDKFEAKKVVFVSFDIKTGGEYCGILQMSAEIVRVDVLPIISKKGTTSNKDTAINLRQGGHAWILQHCHACRPVSSEGATIVE